MIIAAPILWSLCNFNRAGTSPGFKAAAKSAYFKAYFNVLWDHGRAGSAAPTAGSLSNWTLPGKWISTSTALFLSSSFPLAAYTDWVTWHPSAFPINSVHLLPSHPRTSLRKESRISKAAATKTQPGLTSNRIKVLRQWGGSFWRVLCLFKTSLLSWLQTRVWVRRSENSTVSADNAN